MIMIIMIINIIISLSQASSSSPSFLSSSFSCRRSSGAEALDSSVAYQGVIPDRKSSSTSQSSTVYPFDWTKFTDLWAEPRAEPQSVVVVYPFDCRSPRKLSGASVASFASSFQDYCHDVSYCVFQDYCRKFSNSSVGAGSTVGDHANPISPTAVPFLQTSAEAAVSSAEAAGVAVRKFSDPYDYGHRRRSTGGGKAPLFFELDRTGGLRRLASTSLERYRPYMSRLLQSLSVSLVPCLLQMLAITDFCTSSCLPHFWSDLMLAVMSTFPYWTHYLNRCLPLSLFPSILPVR